MFRLLHHSGNLASGGLIVYGLSNIFTTGANYIALPAIIIGLIWYCINNSKELGLE